MEPILMSRIPKMWIALPVLLGTAIGCRSRQFAECLGDSVCAPCGICRNGRCEPDPSRPTCSVDQSSDAVVGDSDGADDSASSGGDREPSIDGDVDGDLDAEAIDSADASVAADATSSCGNRALDAPEDCDDGNHVDGDGCSAACVREIQIQSLTDLHCGAPLILRGDSPAGLAISTTHAIADTNFGYEAVFMLPNLTSSTTQQGSFALLSDLRTRRVYTLSQGGHPTQPFGFEQTIDALIEVNAASGVPTATRTIPLQPPIVLSAPVEIDGRRTSIYSGWGFAIIHQRTDLWRIDLPSGVLTSIGPMPTLGAVAGYCAVGFGGIAESFGGRIYLVDSNSGNSSDVAVFRRRVPDATTSTIAVFASLGRMCHLAITLPLNRWYFTWRGSSTWGDGPAIDYCDAELRVGGGDRIVDPGVKKAPTPGHPMGLLQIYPAGQEYGIANSFVAPAGRTRPVRLIVWLNDFGLGGTPLNLEIWGTAPDGTPDYGNVVATTTVAQVPSSGLKRISLAVASGAMPLVPGQTYWFVASVLSVPDFRTIPAPHRWGGGGHLRNSDGIVDEGRVAICNAAGSCPSLDPPNEEELSFEVVLEP
jgi:cysteine-rich repeat protein